MRVRKLDGGNDWTFGQGMANYINGSDAIRQNVATRIKSFQNDWFLDTDAEIDWFNILGSKNNKNIIEREVERVTKETFGVASVDNVELIKIENRVANIIVKFTTIYDDTFESEIQI